MTSQVPASSDFLGCYMSGVGRTEIIVLLKYMKVGLGTPTDELTSENHTPVPGQTGIRIQSTKHLVSGH